MSESQPDDTGGPPSFFDQAAPHRARGHVLESPDVKDKLMALLRAGNSYVGCLRMLRIPQSSGESYLARGRPDNAPEPHRSFFLEVQAARAMHEAGLVKVLDDAARKGDWRAAAHVLERRHPEEWAPRPEVTGPSERIEIKLVLPNAPGHIDVRDPLPVESDAAIIPELSVQTESTDNAQGPPEPEDAVIVDEDETPDDGAHG